MSSKPVALILGAGANTGAHVARGFANNGYSVAVAARRLNEETSSDGQLHVPADLADPAAVESVFEKVSKALGPPGVVVYNGSHPPSHSSRIAG